MESNTNINTDVSKKKTPYRTKFIIVSIVFVIAVIIGLIILISVKPGVNLPAILPTITPVNPTVTPIVERSIVPTNTQGPSTDSTGIDLKNGFIFSSETRYSSEAGFWYYNSVKNDTKLLFSTPKTQAGIQNNYSIVNGALYYGVDDKYYRFDLKSQQTVALKIPECPTQGSSLCQYIAFRNDNSYVVFKYIDHTEESLNVKIQIIGVENGVKYLDYKIATTEYQGGISTGETEYIRFSQNNDKVLVFSSLFMLPGNTITNGALIFDNTGKLLHTFNSVTGIGWLNNNSLYYQKSLDGYKNITSFDLSTGKESILMSYPYTMINPMQQGNKILTTYQSSVGQSADLYLIDLAKKQYSKILGGVYTTGWISSDSALVVKMKASTPDKAYNYEYGGVGILDLGSKTIKNLSFDKFSVGWSGRLLPVSTIQPAANSMFASPFDLE